MKKIIVLFLMLASIFAYAEDKLETQLKVVELVGIVDVRAKDAGWEKPALDNTVKAGADIYTGFHSLITLEVNKTSYITVNQLTEISIKETLIDKDVYQTEITLTRGYLVIYSKDIDKYKKNKIKVILKNGFIEFDNSGGEIYYRVDRGAMVKSFKGKVYVGAKLNKRYSVNTGQISAILPSGVVYDNDYFIRRAINAAPNSLQTDQEILAYYDLIKIPYSDEIRKNDYYNQTHP